MFRIVSGTRALAHALALLLSVCGALAACGPSIIYIEEPVVQAGKRVVQYEHGGQLFALKNGMRMLVLPDDGTNVAKVEMRYQTGSMSDPAGRAGLAHLLEHLTFGMRASEGDSSTIADSLGQLALSYNAVTTWDYTSYLSFAQRDQVAQLLALEARRMRAGCAGIDDANLQREREVVRNEVRQRGTLARQVVERLLRDAYGPEHPYGRSTGGSDGELVAITRADICSFMDRHYQPGNAVLVVSGDVSVDVARAQFSALFKSIPGKKVIDRPAVAAPTLRGASSQMAMQIAEATAIIAYSAPGFDDPNSAYERLARYLLDLRMDGIRSKDKTITGLSVGSLGGDRAPLTVIVVSVADPAKLRGVVSRIQSGTSDLLKDVNDDVLGFMRERARRQFVTALEPFGDEAQLFGDYLQYATHLEFAFAELNKFDRMNRAEFISFLNSRYKAADSHTVFVSTTEDAPPVARRARLSLAGKNFDLPDWRTRVNVAEADSALPVPETGLRPSMQTFQLDNGLTVIAAPGLGHPVVDIRLIFRGGTLHEPPGKEGVAQLAAALLQPHPHRKYRGHVDPRVAVQVERAIFRMGGQVVASVGELTTTFRTWGLSMYADGLLWELYSQVHASGYFDDKGLQRTRALAQRSKDRSADARERERILLEGLYGAGHRYARVEPPAAVFDRVTRSDLTRFREAHHHAEGATLIITGEFDADFLLPQVRRLFGSMPRRAQPEPQLIQPSARRGGATYVGVYSSGAAQLRIEMSFATEAGVEDDHAERLLLREILDLEMSALRDQLGSTYGVRVNDVRRVGPGMLTISADVDSQRASESFQAMQAVLARVRSGSDAVKATFVRARRSVLQRLLANSVSSSSIADEQQFLVTYGLDAQYHSQLVKRVASMARGHVLAVIERDLDVDGSVVMLSGQRAVVQKVYRDLGITPSVTSTSTQ